MSRSVILSVLMLALVAPVLAACGKKGDPNPPSGSSAPYPRKYPAS